MTCMENDRGLHLYMDFLRQAIYADKLFNRFITEYEGKVKNFGDLILVVDRRLSRTPCYIPMHLRYGIYFVIQFNSVNEFQELLKDAWGLRSHISKVATRIIGEIRHHDRVQKALASRNGKYALVVHHVASEITSANQESTSFNNSQILARAVIAIGVKRIRAKRKGER